LHVISKLIGFGIASVVKMLIFRTERAVQLYFVVLIVLIWTVLLYIGYISYTWVHMKNKN